LVATSARAARTLLERALRDLEKKSNMSQQLSRPIFQSATRERVLVYLALVGKADYVTMAEALSVDWMSVKAAVKRWEKEGVVRSDYFDGNRRVLLNPDFAAAKQLRALLEVLVGGGR
jgi:DNA-binding MarR family transcriptional regulator